MRNTALPVRGHMSNNRAELQALLHVLRTGQRPLSIRTDSEYVANGATVNRLDWRARAWFRRPADALPIYHADMWREVDTLLDARAPATVEVVWRKAHGLRTHVYAGLTTDLDVYGNCGSDHLAAIAAEEVTAGRRTELARLVQQPESTYV